MNAKNVDMGGYLMSNAKIANQEYYNHIASKKEFIKGSPHLKHKTIEAR